MVDAGPHYKLVKSFYEFKPKDVHCWTKASSRELHNDRTCVARIQAFPATFTNLVTRSLCAYLQVRDSNQEVVRLQTYKGYVCLIVNVASYSGFTGEMYKVLNATYDAYESKGLRILAFPCNQFNCEEPGSAEEIRRFFREIGARFDLFDKIDVNGETAHHLYRYLKKQLPNERTRLGVIKDNFTMFLLSRSGTPCVRLEPPVYRAALFDLLTPMLGEPVLSETNRRPWHKKIK